MDDSFYNSNGASKSKLDRDMDEKFKNASVRSKALEERNAARLQNHRDRAAEKSAQDRAKNTGFAQRGADGKRHAGRGELRHRL